MFACDHNAALLCSMSLHLELITVLHTRHRWRYFRSHPKLQCVSHSVRLSYKARVLVFQCTSLQAESILIVKQAILSSAVQQDPLFHHLQFCLSEAWQQCRTLGARLSRLQRLQQSRLSAVVCACGALLRRRPSRSRQWVAGAMKAPACPFRTPVPFQMPCMAMVHRHACFLAAISIIVVASSWL